MRLVRSALFAAVALLPCTAFAGVSLSCSGGSNFCYASVSSPGSPTPFNIYWGYNYSPGSPHVSVVVPANCEDDDFCIFRCPRGDTFLTVSITVTDANNNPIGNASDELYCTAIDL